jgi:cytochrome c-type biogenesis protein CcmH/NrfF
MSARGALAAGAAALMLVAAAPGPAGAAAVRPKTSLTAVWNNYMCTSCHEPLPVAQSPQSYSERAFLKGLIAQGLTKAQIQRQMVANYGEAVLAQPPAHGLDLTVYILPPAILVIGIATLVITLPRWRRRAAAARGQRPGAGPPVDPADAQRLEGELARFDG